MTKTLSLPIYNGKGKKVADMDLTLVEKKNFDVEGTAYQVINAYMASARSGTASTKTRGEVSGSGQKPWSQKGTGRARIGSIRAPHWTGGGVVFGPKPRDFSLKVPKKMKRGLLSQVLLAKGEEGKIKIIRDMGISQGKTSEALAFIKNLKLEGKSTVVVSDKNGELEKRAFKNLRTVRQVTKNELNVYDIFWGDNLLLDENAVEDIKSRLA
jgi:large subunit ribosomal protein L4